MFHTQIISVSQNSHGYCCVGVYFIAQHCVVTALALLLEKVLLLKPPKHYVKLGFQLNLEILLSKLWNVF